MLIAGILAAGLPYIKPADGKVDGHLKEVLALSLETCAHLFTWIPFDGVVLGCGGGDTQQKVVPFGVDFVQVLCKYTEATDMRDVVVSFPNCYFNLHFHVYPKAILFLPIQ